MKTFIYIIFIFSLSYAKAQENQEVAAESKDEQPEASKRCLIGGGLGARGIARPARLPVRLPSRMPTFRQQSSFNGGAANFGSNCGNNCGFNCGTNCGSNFAGNIAMSGPTYGYSGTVYSQPMHQQPIDYFGGSQGMGYNQGNGYHMAGHAGLASAHMYG